jgi:hypothetical protein
LIPLTIAIAATKATLIMFFIILTSNLLLLITFLSAFILSVDKQTGFFFQIFGKKWQGEKNTLSINKNLSILSS